MRFGGRARAREARRKIDVADLDDAMFGLDAHVSAGAHGARRSPHRRWRRTADRATLPPPAPTFRSRRSCRTARGTGKSSARLRRLRAALRRYRARVARRSAVRAGNSGPARSRAAETAAASSRAASKPIGWPNSLNRWCRSVVSCARFSHRRGTKRRDTTARRARKACLDKSNHAECGNRAAQTIGNSCTVPCFC